jgi:hypothetical protein
MKPRSSARPAKTKSLTGRTAGAHGDERLDDVPPGTLRIRVRIEERRETSLLVWLEDAPDQGESRAGQREHPDQLPEASAGHERHPEEDRHEHEAGTEVGLAVDEEHRWSEEHQAAEDRQRRADLVDAVGEELREHDDHEDLRDLAELERETSEVHGALGAERRRADHQDDAEQAEHEQVEERREGTEPRVIEHRDGHHDRDADRGPQRASDDELHRIAGQRP